ncbi:Peptidyl-prolyl cis-trans isomerase fkbp42 [Turnera subulata]|uniref:peptidylprolyl isomerase n=1 Tax=Turnera subulata TaxID=218843 RepID=A0A9Q0FKT6_9ROSI|nr:Peptidyl-prolyl cis-trans isomerase fkbp42 [Turnera subulata]
MDDDDIQEEKSQPIEGDKEPESEIVAEEAAFVSGGLPQDGDGPPKVDCEVEILHEKVTKQTIKEEYIFLDILDLPIHFVSLTSKQTNYICIIVHYRAWSESTQHKFEDTWNEQRPVEVVLGKEKKEMTGLAIGVSNMKAGERSLLHVGWELAYGEEGSFSFPNVPPMADVIYEIELIGFDEVKEGKARADMTVEERIGAADRRKMEGNVLFKEEKLEEAMQQYEMAIAYLGDDFMFQLFGKFRDMALAVKNPCHLNMAACLIKLKRYEEAIGQCTLVLAEDDNNAKALFRRGKARAELGQTDAAREDFLKARKYAPEDKAIARELRLLAEHDKALYQKQKEIYKGIFGPPPESKPKQTGVLTRLWEWLIFVWQWLLTLIFRLFKREKQKAD